MTEMEYLTLFSGPPEPLPTVSPATPMTLPPMHLEMESGDIVHNPRKVPPPNVYVTPRGDPIIQIGFWGPSNTLADSGFSLTSCWTKSRRREGVSFVHCEIRFANDYVCSIHEHTLTHTGEKMPGTVFCRPRELETRDYHFQDLAVSHGVHDTMFRLACSYAADKISFNTTGMYLNFVCPFRWFPHEAEGESFFCSELIATLLREGGVPGTQHLHPSTTSPNDLWDHLTLEREDSFVSCNRNSHMEEKLANLKKLPPPHGTSSSAGKPFYLKDAQ